MLRLKEAVVTLLPKTHWEIPCPFRELKKWAAGPLTNTHKQVTSGSPFPATRTFTHTDTGQLKKLCLVKMLYCGHHRRTSSWLHKPLCAVPLQALPPTAAGSHQNTALTYNSFQAQLKKLHLGNSGNLTLQPESWIRPSTCFGFSSSRVISSTFKQHEDLK